MGRDARGVVAKAARLPEAARSLIGDHTRAVDAVRTALKPIHDEEVARELGAIPVGRLQELTEGRLRLTSVENGGHIDVDRPEPRTTALVTALHVLVEAGPEARRALDTATGLAARLDPLVTEARPATRRFRLGVGPGVSLDKRAPPASLAPPAPARPRRPLEGVSR